MTTPDTFMEDVLPMWTNPDADARATVLHARFTEDVRFCDKDGELVGHAGLETFSASLRDRFPFAQFSLVSAPETVYTRKIRVPKTLAEKPAILLNAVPASRSRIPSVVPDEVEAGRTAARVLLDAGHHDQIGLIGAAPPNRVPKDSLASVQRLQGITEALHAAGAEIAAAIPCPDWQPEVGYDATARLLKKTRPTGLICFNDRLALGAYQALADAGLDVPGDVSVVSFDDDLMAMWVRPRLTTVALPHYELGRVAINLLLDQDQQQRSSGQPAIHRIPMPLRERDSVRRLTRSRRNGRAPALRQTVD
jgi:LacI family transcriptional regulator